MANRTWKSYPPHVAIVEILEKKGPLTDVELYELLRDSYEDLGFRLYNQTLMRMEIEGRIYVSTLTKGKRRIELMKIPERKTN
jgi:hypothetical protein